MIAAGEGPFDFVFIDADKPGNVAYLDAALKLTRPGSVILVDNVVRGGGVLETDSADPSVIGTRALFDARSRRIRASTPVRSRPSATRAGTGSCWQWRSA